MDLRASRVAGREHDPLGRSHHVFEVVDGERPVSQLERRELRIVSTEGPVSSHVGEAPPFERACDRPGSRGGSLQRPRPRVERRADPVDLLRRVGNPWPGYEHDLTRARSCEPWLSEVLELAGVPQRRRRRDRHSPAAERWEQRPGEGVELARRYDDEVTTIQLARQWLDEEVRQAVASPREEGCRRLETGLRAPAEGEATERELQHGALGGRLRRAAEAP